MEAASVAVDVVRDAEAGANDAVAVRIEAQAKAGELQRGMCDLGERKRKRGNRASESHDSTRSLADLGVTRPESGREQQVVSVPPDVHAEHVEETKAAGGGVSTSGPPEGRWGRRVRFGRPSGNARL